MALVLYIIQTYNAYNAFFLLLFQDPNWVRGSTVCGSLGPRSAVLILTPEFGFLQTILFLTPYAQQDLG